MRIIGLAAAARFIGGFKLNTLANRWSFSDNEPIDEVSEKFFYHQYNTTNLTHYSYINDSKLVMNDRNFGAPMVVDFAPRENTPFSVQCKFNLSYIDPLYKSAVIAKWSEVEYNERSWAVFIWDDGSVIFTLSADGIESAALSISSPPGLVSLNKDHHVAVERNSNNLISIYLDGKRIASKTDSRGGYRGAMPTFSVRRGVSGTVWDIQLEHNSVFNGEFIGAVPDKFGKLNNYPGEFYTPEVAADIVYQMSGRRSSTVNEVNGNPLALNKSNMYNGKLFVSNNSAATYSTPIDYFGAGDFTMECKYVAESAITGDAIILMSNWHNGGQVNADNKWLICHLPNGSLRVLFTRSMALNDYVTMTTAAGIISLNRRHHIVIERYNGIIKVFVDGIERLSWSQPGALWSTSNNKIRNTYNGVGHGQHRIWDIRIAKRALYRHTSPVWTDHFPKMPVDWRAGKPTHRLIVGSNDVANGSVTYKGFAKHFQYGSSVISFGELPHELYYNTDTGKVMCIVALFYQTNGYIVMALRESNRPYTPGMPTMTNRVKVAGGATVDFTQGALLSSAVRPGVISKHFGVGNVANWATAFATDETEVSFTFV